MMQLTAVNLAGESVVASFAWRPAPIAPDDDPEWRDLGSGAMVMFDASPVRGYALDPLAIHGAPFQLRALAPGHDEVVVTLTETLRSYPMRLTPLPGFVPEVQRGASVAPSQSVPLPRAAGILAQVLPREQRSFNPAESAGLFVGVRNFFDVDGRRSTSLQEVPYAVDDAVDLAHLFVIDLALVSPTRTKLCLSGEPQKEESRRRLDRLLAAGVHRDGATVNLLRERIRQAAQYTEPGGMLVMTFATHGIHTEAGDDCLLAQDSLTWDTDSMLKARYIADKISLAKAPRRITLFDVCRERMGEGRGLRDSAAKLSATFGEALGRASGTFALFASPVGGYSFDDHVRKNGVFSGAFVRAFDTDPPADGKGIITLGAVVRRVRAEVDQWIRMNHPDRAGAEIHNQGDFDLDQMPLASTPAAGGSG